MGGTWRGRYGRRSFGVHVVEVLMPYRRRADGTSKVAGGLRGTARAGAKTAAMSARKFAREFTRASGRGSPAGARFASRLS